MIESLPWAAIEVTVKLALITTVLLLGFAIPFSWWLVRSKSRFRPLVEAVVSLPMVLPPTVLGFYLLVLLGNRGPLGILLTNLGLPKLVFSFEGLVFGSLIYSLPFVVQPIRTAFAAIPEVLLDAASMLRPERWFTFLRIIIPMSKQGIVSACVLGFAHTIGEFGVVLMIGGNIPGLTKVLSISIYEYVELLEYDKAHLLSAILLFTSLALMTPIYYWRSRRGSSLEVF